MPWTPTRLVGLILIAGAVALSVADAVAPEPAASAFYADHTGGQVWSRAYELELAHTLAIEHTAAAFALLGAAFLWLPGSRWRRSRRAPGGNDQS